MGQDREQKGARDERRDERLTGTIADSDSRSLGSDGSSHEFPRVVARMPQVGGVAGWGRPARRLSTLLFAWVLGKSYRWVGSGLLFLLVGTAVAGYLLAVRPAGRVDREFKSLFPDELVPDGISTVQTDYAGEEGVLGNEFPKPVISRESEDNVLSLGTDAFNGGPFQAVGYQEVTRSSQSGVAELPVVAAEDDPLSGGHVADGRVASGQMNTTQVQRPLTGFTVSGGKEANALPTWADLAQNQVGRPVSGQVERPVLSGENAGYGVSPETPSAVSRQVLPEQPAPSAVGAEQSWTGYQTPAVRGVSYETRSGTPSSSGVKSNFRDYRVDTLSNTSRAVHPTNYSASEQGYDQSKNRW